MSDDFWGGSYWADTYWADTYWGFASVFIITSPDCRGLGIEAEIRGLGIEAENRGIAIISCEDDNL